MRKIFFTALILTFFCTAFVPAASSFDGNVIFNTDFTIEQNHIHFSRDSIELDEKGKGVITVTNNTPDKKIIDGYVLFNKKRIKLKKGFKKKKQIIEKKIKLHKNNRLIVFLSGQLGASINVTIKKKGTTPSPPEVNLSADPSSIAAGESSTLTWSTKNAESCDIQPGIGSVDPNGSISVSPTETTTYTITATGSGGTATAQATVTVIHPEPTATISVDPETILAGEITTLTWSSAHAETAEISPDIGAVEPTGTTEISPTESTTYTITVTGPGGSATASVTVMVLHQPTVTISANPQAIMAGESATLTWNSTHAESCDIQPGIGNVGTSGNINVSLLETTTYTITATGAGGTATAQTTVTVIHPQPTVSISADPETIPVGESATLAWSSTNAVSVEISPDIGTVDPSGTLPVSPAESTTYTITATGPGGSATAETTVTVLQAPEVTFSASPQSIEAGESAVLSWTSVGAQSAYIDNGVGVVPPNGEISVSPLHSTTYTLTVTGQIGSASSRATVMVHGNPAPSPEGSFGSRYPDLIPPDATVAAYDAKRFSLIIGEVQTLDGIPLAGVAVTIHDHPEYGTAFTDATGRFSIPVEGGGVLKTVYRKEDFLTAHRGVYVPWNDLVAQKTVRMVEQDAASTRIHFDGNPDTVLTHQSTSVSDAFGTRASSVVFTGDNRAFFVDDNGNDIHELTTITTRATEFETPESMPAVLPPNSAYTYCVELAVDGIKQVRFEKPVIVWVDNFLGFEVGEAVPVGYYDPKRAVWVPSDSGFVVKLLDTDSNGIVDAIDVDGDDLADDVNGNGDYHDEADGLDDPEKYNPGATYWRFAVTHFTSWDANWGFGPPDNAIVSNAKTLPVADQQKKETHSCPINRNSFTEERSRIFHEDIPIPGTNMTLHYASSRVQGYKTKITIPASGDTVPENLRGIIVKVEMAGQIVEQQLDPLPNQFAEVIWDGKDFRGNFISATSADIRVGFTYDGVYQRTYRFGSNGGVIITGSRTRQQVTLWKNYGLFIGSSGGEIAEGWTLSAHHNYNPLDSSSLFKGDGFKIKNTAIITTVAGKGTAEYSGDGGPATEAGISWPSGVTVDEAGNLYIADTGNHCIRKVDTDGVISTVAGNGNAGSAGDGGPATQAYLKNPAAVAMDAVGNLYIADFLNDRVRKVNTEGIISNVAGTGEWGFSGDGGPATEAGLIRPAGVSVDAAGNLYISDYENFRVRKVDTDRIINTVAGNGTWGAGGDGGPATEASFTFLSELASDVSGNLFLCDALNNRVRKVDTSGIITTVGGSGAGGYYGDGGPATEASIHNPSGVAVDAVGNLYIADEYNNRIRKVDTSGFITTVAGIGTAGFGGDGGPAAVAGIYRPTGVAVDAAGNLYIADSYNQRIRKVSLPAISVPSALPGDVIFTEENGLVYIISSSGRHKRTIDQETGVTLFEFGYDENDKLISITDRLDNQIIITREPDGVPTHITSPDGLVTALTIDGDNHLIGITYPDDSHYAFEYTADGLMTAEIEPEGNRFENQFDAVGRLAVLSDDEGGEWQYSRTVDAAGDILTQVTSGEGNITTYLDHQYSTGRFTSTITGPAGGETVFAEEGDGLSATKSLSCGMALEFKYDLDPEYKFRFVKEMVESTPSGLIRVTETQKSYADTDADDVPDLITKTVTVNGKATTFENNVLQSQKKVISPEGRTVTTAYDPGTLLTTSLSTPGLYDTGFGYDTNGRLTSILTDTRSTGFSYNAQGFLETVTDALGRVTTYTHDEIGRITNINRPDQSTVGFTYDQNGNMTVLTNPATIDHGFGYNGVNRKNAYQTPLSGSYSYAYDKDRRLTQTIFPSGKQITNVYDMTRLSQIQTPEGNIDFTYLCGTKVGSVTNGADTIAYEYDGSLVTTETLNGTLGQLLSYTYNNDFELVGFSYAGDTVNFNYDDDGLLITAGAFTITRNANNGLPVAVSGGAFNLVRTFNGYGEISGQTSGVNGQDVITWTLVRDDNGRIAQKTETLGGVTSTYVYAYDPGGRLLSVTKDDTLVEEYQYSANGTGTRTHEMNSLRNIAGRSFTYSDEDHLLTAGGASYQYDVDGFLATKTSGTDVTTYTYSSRGELLQVTLPDGKLIEYVHDPLGRRIAKKIDGTTVEKYLWQGLTRLLAVYDGSDNLLMRFEYADGRMPVAVTAGGVTYYLTYDQVGSLRMVADSSGSVVKRIDYDSFGNIIDDTNPTFVIPFGFAGGLQDRDTGLVRFGYRDYDPDVGRWTAKDPIGFAGGDTDLYGYCLNDPVNLIDPLGLIVTYWGIGGAAGVGPPTEGDTPNYKTVSGVVYEGTRRGGGTEQGIAGQIGVGRIGGLTGGGGLVGGFHIGDVEDFSGRGNVAGVTFGFLSLELTFDENNSWTGMTFGLFRSWGAGIYGLETVIGRLPLSSRTGPCR